MADADRTHWSGARVVCRGYVPVVALIISSVFENLSWHPMIIAGMLVSIAVNVLALSDSAS